LFYRQGYDLPPGTTHYAVLFALDASGEVQVYSPDNPIITVTRPVQLVFPVGTTRQQRLQMIFSVEEMIAELIRGITSMTVENGPIG
jgi:hypothetical protein